LRLPGQELADDRDEGFGGRDERVIVHRKRAESVPSRSHRESALAVRAR
jgi:hypothetical protein